MVANAREFLFAIKESTHTVFDHDAVEYLDGIRAYMTAQLDKQPNLTPAERDAIFFFEGMLRGTQLKLKQKQHRTASKLSALGLLKDGKPTLDPEDPPEM